MTTEPETSKVPPFHDLKDILKEISKEAQNSKIPIFIAFLAGFLALVSMAEGDVNRQALASHIEASNQFSYFQAKNIRKTDSEVASDILEAMGKGELAEKWRQKAARYDKEKSEILSKARAEQKTRNIALKQAAYFDFAIAALQIAIVLASASLLMGGGSLLIGSYLLTFVAFLFVVNGYGLFFEIPTDPSLIWKSMMS